MAESPAEIISIELSSLERGTDRVSFREWRAMRGGQIDPGSLRPVREGLTRRMVDCRSRRIATLSRAVFSDDDALIDHRAVRPSHAEWKLIEKDDTVFRLVCGGS